MQCALVQEREPYVDEQRQQEDAGFVAWEPAAGDCNALWIMRASSALGRMTNLAWRDYVGVSEKLKVVGHSFYRDDDVNLPQVDPFSTPNHALHRLFCCELLAQTWTIRAAPKNNKEKKNLVDITLRVVGALKPLLQLISHGTVEDRVPLLFSRWEG